MELTAALSLSLHYIWPSLCVFSSVHFIPLPSSLPSPQLLSALDWFYTSFIHVSSLGDGFREAPDAELIEPKVDEFSELIKYKLFDLNISEADIHIMEDSIITRLQVGSQLYACNGAALSAFIAGI